MRNTTAIMNRELLSLFCSPVAYIVIAGFLLVTGVLAVFTGSFKPGAPATLRMVFEFTPYALAFIVPAIAMRTISEEYRSGTIEALMTAPVSDAQLVLGKFLASLVFYVIMIATTLVYLMLMMVYGAPDLGASLAAYIGLILVGTMFVALGVLASSLTKNQIVAWMIAAVPLLVFVWFSGWISRAAEGWWREVFRIVNISLHLDQFNRGLIDTEGVVFFLCTAAFFLFLAVKVVESRRWR
ncbi:MAG: ABC transporter permease subunit [Phycisphaerae bacterium]|nr:ABC transporter permease subunit [Phycisphaerae bacterium]